MRIEFLIESGIPYLKIEYLEKEYEKISKLLEQLNLEKAETQNLFGLGERAQYFRERNRELLNYIKNTLVANNVDINKIEDDINRPLFYNYRFNIALFRIIPETKDNKFILKIKLDRFLTILELTELIKIFKKVLEVLFNIVTNKKLEIIIKEEKLELEVTKK